MHIFREPEEPVVEAEKNAEPEKPTGHEDVVDATKEIPPIETEKNEPEEKVNCFFLLKSFVDFMFLFLLR